MIRKRIVSILSAMVVAAMAAVPMPQAQAAAPKPVLQGTYLETIRIAGENRTTAALVTFTSDGSVIASDINRQGTRLVSHGSWDKVGNRRFAVTIWTLNSNLPATPECTFIVRETRSTLTLIDSGDSYTSIAEVRIFDCQGNQLALIENVMVEGRRLDVKLPGE